MAWVVPGAAAVEELERRLVLSGTVSAEVLNSTVAPGDDLQVYWRVDKDLVDLDRNGTVDAAEAGNVNLTLDVPGLLAAQATVTPALGSNADLTLEGDLEGVVNLPVPADAPSGGSYQVWETVSIPPPAASAPPTQTGGVVITGRSNVGDTLNVRAPTPVLVDSSRNSLSPADRLTKLYPKLDASWLGAYATSLDPVNLDSQGGAYPGSRAWLIQDIASRELKIHYALMQGNRGANLPKFLPAVLSDAFDGNAKFHSYSLLDPTRFTNNWDPNKPTIILVHGIREYPGEWRARGVDLKQVVRYGANVLTFFYGYTDPVSSGTQDLMNGTVRSIPTLLQAANSPQDAAATFGGRAAAVAGTLLTPSPYSKSKVTAGAFMYLDGLKDLGAAADLHLLIRLLGEAYKRAGKSAGDNVNVVAHSLGTVITTAALSLDPPTFDDPVGSTYALNQELYIGSDLDQRGTLPGNIAQPLLHLTSLYSAHDGATWLAGGEGPFRDSAGQEIVRDGIHSFDAEALNAGTDLDGRPIIHSPEIPLPLFKANIGWWDWLTAKQGDQQFLTNGIATTGAGPKGFAALAAQEKKDGDNARRPLAEGNYSAAPGGEPGARPTVDSIRCSDKSGPKGLSASNSFDQSPGVSISAGQDPILAAAPDPVIRGDYVIAEAISPVAPTGRSITQVDFYRDLNGDGQPEANEYLGSDTSPSGGWQRMFDTTDWTVGPVTLLTIVGDSQGAVSDPRATTFQLAEQASPPVLPVSIGQGVRPQYSIVPTRNGDVSYDAPNYPLALGQIDYWQVTPQTGGGFAFETTGNTDTVLGLYDSATGQMLQSDEDSGTDTNARIVANLIGGKTYLLGVSTERGSAGGYGLNVTGATTTLAGTLELPPPLYTSSVTGSVATPYAVNYYAAIAPAGTSRLDVHLNVAPGLDGWVRVEDGQHQILATSFLAGPGTPDVIQSLPVVPGQQYYVTVTAIDGSTGAYTLTADFNPDDPGLPDEILPAPAVSAMTPLVPGADGSRLLTNRVISQPGQFDYYLVTVPQALAGNFTFETSGDLDTQLGLYQYPGDRGVLVAWDDDSGEGSNAKVTASLSAGGQYIVVVRTDGNQLGTYSLSLAGPPQDPVTVNLTPSGLSSLVSSGFIGLASNQHFYQYSVTAPSNATTLSINSEHVPNSTALDLSLRVTDASGNQVAFANAQGPGGNEQLTSVPVQAGQTYYITAYGENLTLGSYRLNLDFDPDFTVTAGTVFQINESGNAETFPTVGEDAAGASVVAWEDDKTLADGSTVKQVSARRFNAAGQPVGSTFRVNQADLADYEYPAPKVVVAPDGSFVVAWTHGGLFVRRFSAQGVALTGDVGVPGGSLASAEYRLAVGPGGQFALIWKSYDPADPKGGIYLQLFTAAGSPLGGLVHVNTTTAESQLGPDVCYNPDGSLLAVWDSETGRSTFKYRVFAQALDASGNKVGPEFQVSTATSGSQNYPRIASGSDGTKVVVWYGDGPDGTPGASPADIYARRLDANNQFLGTEFLVNTVTAGNQSYPAVTMGSQGKFLVVWMNQASGQVVSAQQFGPNGARSGPEIALSGALPGDLIEPEVAGNGVDQALTVWYGGVAAGAGNAIYGRSQSLAPVLEPELHVTDSSGAPGDRFVNFGTGGAAPPSPQTITVSNTGNSPLVVSAVDVYGADAGAFSLDDASGFTLAPGASHPLTVSFQPGTRQGDYYAAVRLTHNDNAGTLTGTDWPNPFWVSLLGTVPDTTPPTVGLPAVAPSPRATPVDQLTFSFSEAITGFDLSDLVLSREGGSNLLPGAATLASSDGGVTWTLDNLASLTAAPGSYTLSLAAAGSGIADLSGNALAAGVSSTWSVDPPGLVPSTGAVYAITGPPGLASAKTLTVTSGTVWLTSDISATYPNLTVSVSAGATVVFNSPQHLSGLMLAANASAAVTPAGAGGPPRSLVVSSINIDPAAKLDLADNLLQINFGTGPDPDATVASLVAGGAIYSSTLPAGRMLSSHDDPAAGVELVGTGPSLLSSSVNGGAAQRSVVNSLSLTFSGPVVLSPGALTLSLLTTDSTGTVTATADVSAGVSWSSPDGGTTWVASVLNGGIVDGNGSLADGVYRLTLHATAVTVNSLPLAGGDQFFTFHRLFGDTDGNKTVNALDYARFKQAFGSSIGTAGYNAVLDFDGNGTVNALDYAQFKKRFGMTFVY